jgi:hypothetical protein
MSIAQTVLTFVARHILDWMFFLILLLLVLDFYIKSYRMNKETEIDLLGRYVDLQMRRRYK